MHLILNHHVDIVYIKEYSYVDDGNITRRST